MQSFDVQLRRAAIREAINVVDLSLGLVMAGTGDIACLQRLRIRHGLFGPHIRYGAHIATHMAIGFLFMGGGRYTLGTSNAPIASLVVSLFPRFPLHTNETRGLLQAFRHLWVMAVEPRCLIARDADTNEITRIPIKVKIKEGADDPVRTHHFVCPTLLPDFERFVSIKVDSPRYWPFVLNLNDDPRAKLSLLQTQTIYVKRRAGYSAYTEDPTGYQSISVWNGTPVGDPAILDFPNRDIPHEERAFHDMRHFTKSSTSETYLFAFADRFCRYPGRNTREVATLSYAQQSILDVLSGDKHQMLPTLLSLYRLRSHIPAGIAFSGFYARDLHLASEFYSLLFRFHGGLVDSNPRQPLIRAPVLQGAVTMLGMLVDYLRHDPAFVSAFRAFAETKDVDVHNVPSFSESEDSDGLTRRRILRSLAFVLQHDRVPTCQTLLHFRRLSRKATEGATTSRGSSRRVVSSEDPEWSSASIGLSMILQKTALSLSGPRTIPWPLRSIQDFLDIWYGPR